MEMYVQRRLVVESILRSSLCLWCLANLSFWAIIAESFYRIGVILPFANDHPWSVPKTRPAIEYAIETVNRFRPLRGGLLTVQFADSRCSDTFGPLEAVELYHRRRPHVFLGPACEYAVAPVARFSPLWNIPVITAGALVGAFVDKKQYRLLTRISGSFDKLAEFFPIFYRHFDWNVTNLIYSNNLGDRQPLGRTMCFFIMQSVYAQLTKSLNRRQRDIPSMTFDEQAKADDPVYKSYEDILRSVSLNSRSNNHHRSTSIATF